MKLLKCEVCPKWWSSLICPACAPLGTSPTGKGSFPKHKWNFRRWELKGLGVQVGADTGGVGSRTTQGPSAKSQAGLVREQCLAKRKAHLGSVH